MTEQSEEFVANSDLDLYSIENSEEPKFSAIMRPGARLGFARKDDSRRNVAGE